MMSREIHLDCVYVFLNLNIDLDIVYVPPRPGHYGHTVVCKDIHTMGPEYVDGFDHRIVRVDDMSFTESYPVVPKYYYTLERNKFVRD